MLKKLVIYSMNDFTRCNKINGVYWLKQAVEDLKIRIQVKQQASIISLPKFEDFSRSHKFDAQSLENKINEHSFKWQEKVFSRWETKQYTNVHNCITETELEYHRKLKNNHNDHNKIFTYINEDYRLTLPLQMQVEKKANIPNLNYFFERLNLESVGKDNVTSSMTHLFTSDDNVSLNNEQWIAMHVALDNSEYSEDSDLLYKQEHILSSIYYNADRNFIILSPDTNNLTLNPYIAAGMQYAIEVDYGGGENGEELVMVLNKLHTKWEKKQKRLLKFTMPPLGKRKIYMSLEIVSARNFDMDDIYIEYHIKIPDNIECSSLLQGKTHTSSALITEDDQEWKYGHLVDLEIDVATGLETPTIKVYLEAISVDWWGRHRTEGYTRLALTPVPGRYCKQLSCSCPEEMSEIEAENRRFFVGGCHLIKDLSVLDQQQTEIAGFRFVTTGTVLVRWDVITQRSVPGVSAASGVGGGGGGALRDADAALRRYQRARGRLAAVAGDVGISGEGLGTV